MITLLFPSQNEPLGSLIDVLIVCRYYAGSSEEKTAKRQIFKAHLNGQKVDQVECLTCTISTRHLSDFIHHAAMPIATSPTVQIPLPSESIFQAGANVNNSHPRHFHVNSSCRYSNALLGPNFDFYVHECLGPFIPYVEVRSLPANKLVKLLQTNQQLRNDSVDKAFPRLLQLRIPLVADGASHPWKRNKPDYAIVQLYLPPGLKEEDNLIYPLILWT